MIGVDAAIRLERARAGAGRAFKELIASVLDPGFRLAMTMLKDGAAAEDAVQDAAFKAWRKLDHFRAGSELRPWLLAIVANECRTARRSRWFHVVRLGDLAPSPWPDADPAGRIDLDMALDRLAPHHLLALSLYYQLDLPIEDVARVLGCSPNAARQRIHRALAALRPGLAMEPGL